VKNIVLDASALLRFVDNETGSERVAEYLQKALGAELAVLISSVNWGEVVYSVLKAHGEKASSFVSELKGLPIEIVPASIERAEDAARFKHTHGIPYADAFAGSLAMEMRARLVTTDYDFHGISPTGMQIELLPAKRK
jgi:predicted nucleic acid-binding protein